MYSYKTKDSRYLENEYADIVRINIRGRSELNHNKYKKRTENRYDTITYLLTKNKKKKKHLKRTEEAW